MSSKVRIDWIRCYQIVFKYYCQSEKIQHFVVGLLFEVFYMPIENRLDSFCLQFLMLWNEATIGRASVLFPLCCEDGNAILVVWQRSDFERPINGNTRYSSQMQVPLNKAPSPGPNDRPASTCASTAWFISVTSHDTETKTDRLFICDRTNVVVYLLWHKRDLVK